MKTISFEQMVLVIFAAAAAAAAIMLLSGASVVGGAVTGFVMALSAFLSVDLAKTVVRTAAKPAGDYENFNKGRYYFGLALVAILFVLTLLRASEGIQIETAQTSLITAFMIIIGLLISGIQGNKIATGKGPEK